MTRLWRRQRTKTPEATAPWTATVGLRADAPVFVPGHCGVPGAPPGLGELPGDKLIRQLAERMPSLPPPAGDVTALQRPAEQRPCPLPQCDDGGDCRPLQQLAACGSSVPLHPEDGRPLGQPVVRRRSPAPRANACRSVQPAEHAPRLPLEAYAGPRGRGAVGPALTAAGIFCPYCASRASCAFHAPRGSASWPQAASLEPERRLGSRDREPSVYSSERESLHTCEVEDLAGLELCEVERVSEQPLLLQPPRQLPGAQRPGSARAAGPEQTLSPTPRNPHLQPPGLGQSMPGQPSPRTAHCPPPHTQWSVARRPLPEEAPPPAPLFPPPPPPPKTPPKLRETVDDAACRTRPWPTEGVMPSAGIAAASRWLAVAAARKPDPTASGGESPRSAAADSQRDGGSEAASGRTASPAVPSATSVLRLSKCDAPAARSLLRCHSKRWTKMSSR
mmetsp:Transcript_9413/g.28355  ORF Transcript_9413/g.28355 Transcript_9413/m.28355 type:complete len:448 (+) Transcript_9413:88-1431(+)